MAYSHALKTGLEDFSGCWKFQYENDGSLGIIAGQEGDTKFWFSFWCMGFEQSFKNRLGCRTGWLHLGV